MTTKVVVQIFGDRANDFAPLCTSSAWDALTIANTAWYVDWDVAKTKLILDKASELAIHPYDIASLFRKLK